MEIPGIYWEISSYDKLGCGMVAEACFQRHCAALISAFISSKVMPKEWVDGAIPGNRPQILCWLYEHVGVGKEGLHTPGRR